MRRHLHSVPLVSCADTGGTSPIRVVVAVSHPLMRQTLKRLLKTEADLEVIAEATDVETAMQLLRAHRPQVLVLDVRMPDGSIIDTLRHLRTEAHRTEFIVVTMDNTQILADQVLSAGATGFVLKDAADTELADAVRRAAACGRECPSAGVS